MGKGGGVEPNEPRTPGISSRILGRNLELNTSGRKLRHSWSNHCAHDPDDPFSDTKACKSPSHQISMETDVRVLV